MKDTVKCSMCLLLLVTCLRLTLADSGKISKSLMAKLTKGGKVDAIVELPSIVDSVFKNPILATLADDAATDMLIKLLTEACEAAQAPIITVIKNSGFTGKVEGLWISNVIFIEGLTLSLANLISNLKFELILRLQVKVKFGGSDSWGQVEARAADEPAEWGVKKIEAPAVWKSTTKGEGVIVAGIDTGVQKEHEALISNYANGWLDAVSKKPKPDPFDDNGHGTHTMGTIVGQKGIGVAPGAKWIACKGLAKDGSGLEAPLKKCAEFVTKFKPKPKVVCNSWGGGRGLKKFDDTINIWIKAKITPVFSIGNVGSKCNTSSSPGDRMNVISVGAVNRDDTIASFSSRGYAKGTDMIKPEVCAPGVAIRSAFIPQKNSYTALNGTSMAAPHVAGVVALMSAANKNLQFKDFRRILEETAVRPTLTKKDLECGKAADGKNWPNNAFGHGRINAKKAVEMAMKQ